MLGTVGKIALPYISVVFFKRFRTRKDTERQGKGAKICLCCFVLFRRYSVLPELGLERLLMLSGVRDMRGSPYLRAGYGHATRF